ncbi:MAG: hypothetical protein K6E27_06445 [Eubacterium sp.]|nr:hypothetical protein [Eubacterium sp.]
MRKDGKRVGKRARVLAVILVGAMAFGLTGCGGIDDTASDKKRRTDKSSSIGDKLEQMAENQQDTEDLQPQDGGDYSALSTEEETTEDTGAGSGQPGVLTGFMPCIYSESTTYYVEDDDYTTLYQKSYDILKLQDGTEEEYPGVKKALDNYNSAMESAGEDYTEEELVATAKEMKENDSLYSYLYDGSTAYIQRVDDNILSILHTFEDYYGGAHGYYGCTGYNYDPSTGEEMSIEDVVSSMDDLKAAAQEMFSRDYAYLIENEPGCEDSLAESFDDPETLCWTLGPEELQLYYNPYHLASYAAGMQIIKIRIADYPDLFNKGIGVAEGDWIIKLPDDGMLEDIDGDGSLDYVDVTFNYFTEDESDYSYLDSIDVVAGNGSKTIVYYGFEEGDVYFIKKGDSFYLYILGTAENDYKFIQMVDITDGNVRDLNSFDGTFTAKDYTYDYGEGYYSATRGLLYNPNFFYVRVRHQYISTLDATAPAEVGDNGEIKLLQDYYDLPTDFCITSKVGLELDEVDADGNVIGKTNISSGTDYYMYRSDGTSYVDCKTEDGKYVRIVIDDSEYPFTVNGIDLEEAFDGIIFAG